MRVLIVSTLKYFSWLVLGLLAGLAACQSRPEAASQPTVAGPPTGHFAGTLTATGHPALRAALEVRHPRLGHYDAELVVANEPALSFVADTLSFTGTALHLTRPGQPSEVLMVQQQGDFWRGSLVVDSTTYTTLLVRRGPPEPMVYRVRRDEVAGPSGTALLFSPADESLPGAAVAVFPTPATAATSPAWADALARQGYTVLLLPAADSLPSLVLMAALTYLRRTPGVDTARVGAWAAGPRATELAALLAGPTKTQPTPAPAFVVAQAAPAPNATTHRAWYMLGQRGPVLGVYETTDAATTRTATSLQTALGGRQTHVVRGQQPALMANVLDWLRAL